MRKIRRQRLTFNQFIRLAAETGKTQTALDLIVRCPLCGSCRCPLLAHLFNEHSLQAVIHEDNGVNFPAEWLNDDTIRYYGYLNTFRNPSAHIRELAVIAALRNTPQET